ncbi:CASP-like protein 1 [Bidens hawaiensis]|uniref:CASP-like protein 1 n=1 Tax=Bidens hawaiensis TaxID=980011 RepID=UPI004049FA11
MAILSIPREDVQQIQQHLLRGARFVNYKATSYMLQPWSSLPISNLCPRFHRENNHSLEGKMFHFSSNTLEQTASGADGIKNHGVVIDAVLRAVVLVAGVAAIIIMVTSKQSKLMPLPFSPTTIVSLDANWNQIPAYVYFVAAFSTAGLYSIITGVSSVLILKKTGRSSTRLQFCFVILDSLLLAILSAALGAELAVSWIGLKGNSHSFWHEVCNTYGSFCHHLSAAATMATVSIIAVLLLVWHSYYTIWKKIASR